MTPVAHAACSVGAGLKENFSRSRITDVQRFLFRATSRAPSDLRASIARKLAQDDSFFFHLWSRVYVERKLTDSFVQVDNYSNGIGSSRKIVKHVSERTPRMGLSFTDVESG